MKAGKVLNQPALLAIVFPPEGVWREVFLNASHRPTMIHAPAQQQTATEPIVRAGFNSVK